MVSITNINSGQAGHYYARDDYYSKSHGQWTGKGAEALGLRGEVEREDFQHLLSGCDRHGNGLVPPGPNGHRAGVDLTFSAPKSVSLISHVMGDERVKKAHEKAVSATLSLIEERYSQARGTKAGDTKKIDTGNMVIAKFDHHTSRELDPQLHTHCVVMNLTWPKSGKWKALSNENLYQHKMYIGQFYRNELAANLKELGYGVKTDHKGLFEVKGFDRKLLEHFSQRSEQIAEKISELKNSSLYPNASGQKLREIAALGSRIAKRDVNSETIKEAWMDRLKEQGYSIERIRGTVHEAGKEMYQSLSKPTGDYITQAARIITENESVFTREQILKNASKLSLGEYRMKDLEKAFEQARGKEIVRLDRNAYTTKEMKRIERSVLLKVQEGWDKTLPLVDRKQVNELLNKHRHLTNGQAKAVEHILTSRDRVIGIQGDAGTGKTTALKVIRKQLGKEGIGLMGLGFTGKAAEEVEKNAGIKSQTVDSFLSSVKSHGAGGRQVWIVDEASMLGSRKTQALLEKAERADAKVVLIGDTKQLQAIEAGRMFDKLQETGTLKTVEMKETLRQQDPGYREIVRDIAAKKIDTAFEKLKHGNRLIEIAGREERLAAIVRDFTNRNYRNALIVTTRNADRNELNTLIRSELKVQNKLQGQERYFTVRESKSVQGAERHFAQNYQPGDVIYTQKTGILGRAGTEARVMEVNDTDHTLTVVTRDSQLHQIDLREHGEHISAYREKQQGFTAGDRIVFCKNDKALHVQNGVTATIKNIDERGNITAVTDSGKKIEFNAARYRYFDAGYAVTDYKSQGQTSREVLYHAGASREASYNQFYTAITRGKDDVKVYTDSKETLKEQVRNEQLKTSTLDYRDIERTEGWEIENRDPATREPRDRDSEHYREEGKEERVLGEQEKSKDMDRER
ncbi:MAG: relaxase domain-containing protein [Nitrospirae bacterium]|nr:relaxase domain-containing protein [Nitrospirota bacterium]